MGKLVEVSESESNAYLRVRKARIQLPVEVAPVKVKKVKIDKDLIPRKAKPASRPFNPKAKPVFVRGKKTFKLLDAERFAQHSPREALAQIKRKRLRSVRKGVLVKLGIETPNVNEVIWAEVRNKLRNGQIVARIQEPTFHTYMHGLDQGSRIKFSLRNVMDVAIHARVVDRKIWRPDEV